MRFRVLTGTFLVLASLSLRGFASGGPDYSAETKVTIPPKSYSADELTEKEPIPWWEKIWIVKKGRRLLG